MKRAANQDIDVLSADQWQGVAASQQTGLSTEQIEARQLSIKTVGLVLQSVTYSLWSWTLIALSVVATTALSYFFAGAGDDYTFLSYFVATLICLLPIAAIVDHAFSKRTLLATSNFRIVVMVFHAVTIFLISVGALIAAVVAAVSLLIQPTSSDAPKVAMLAAVIVASLFGLLFCRIIGLKRMPDFQALFPYIIIAFALLAVLLAAVGPLRHDYQRRTDKVIESGLPAISSAVANYQRKYNKLPSSLHDIDVADAYGHENAEQVTNRKLVAYKALSQEATTTLQLPGYAWTYNPDSKSSTWQQRTQTNVQRARYQLCTTYAKKRGDGSQPDSSYSYAETYRHPAGYVCYNLQA